MDLITAKSLFQPATGFIKRGGFDYTCNPYVGCSFGCTYCYAMFLPQNRRPKGEWGRWLQAKENAVEIAHRDAKKVVGKSVYMSSVTDPYLPAERSLQLTRGVLEALIPFQPRLLVQTRGPLVTRDIDLLQQFEKVRVNITIPTDSDGIWSVFEPKSPPLEARWKAARQLRCASVPVGLCLTPLLPLDDEIAFVKKIAEFGPDVLAIQGFHDSHGGFGADTGPVARQLLDEGGCSSTDFARFADLLGRHHITFFEAEAGFFPP